MSKELFFHGEVKTKLKSGLDKLADMVKITLGPMGRNVIIEQEGGSPVITKDGVTVASKINLPDRVENLGANLVKEVASKTNGAAGDGTTSATVLAQAIVHEGLQLDIDAQRLRKEIEEATQKVNEALVKSAIPLEGDAIKHVGAISANDKELGELIAEAVRKVGKEGVVTVEQSNDFGVKIRQVEGMQLKNGYVSPHFVTDRTRGEAVYEKVPILLVDGKLDNIPDLAAFLENVVISGTKNLVIIAEDFDDPIVGMFVMNKVQGMFNSLLIKAPSFGDRRSTIIDDIAVVTGATVVSEKNAIKLKTAPLSVLGSIAKIIATKDTTTIIDGAGDKEAVEKRISEIKAAIEHETNDFDKQFLRERLSRLTGGVAIISVGAPSEVEMVERRHRIEDAVHAVKAAMEEGVVAGGGVALLRACQVLKGANDGENILLKALVAPIKQIAKNAGHEGQDIIKRLQNTSDEKGWDATSDTIVDMFAAGIVDPLKVTRSALQNAVSVAVMILTTEGGITAYDKEKRESV